MPSLRTHKRRGTTLSEGKDVAPDSGQGKALRLDLHAKGNRPACKYIVFGDATHA